jgi:hypothetical protein
MPTFNLDESEQLEKWLNEGIQEGVKAGLLSAANRMVGVIQNEIIPAEKPQPVGVTGLYRAAWKAEPTPEGASVYNDMPYASVIEYGARAENIKIGRKMIDALADWARIKGLTGHAPKHRASPEAFSAARQLAWAIARTMQGVGGKPGKGIFNRDGQQGLRIAEKAVKKAADFIEEEIRGGVRRMLKK